MNDKKNNKKNDRQRNWTFVLYPESVPINWREQLNELHMPWVESPLHDRCINPDGTQKKSHWHVVILFDGSKSFDQVKEITDSLNAPIPQKVASAMGVIRYMTHMDNPEKVQYSKDDIVAHGGADVARYFKMTATNRYEAIREMRKFVRDNVITEFSDLFDYADEHRFEDWFPLLCDNSAYIIGQYIKSLRSKQNRYEPDIQVKVVNEAGEILRTYSQGVNE